MGKSGGGGENQVDEVLKKITEGRLKKGKSCKGCLFYSSVLKSKSRDPLCLGFTRSLQNVPGDFVREREMGASDAISNPQYFKYACIGYSVKLDKDSSGDSQVELPFCVGIEILVDKKASAPDHGPVHDHHVVGRNHHVEDGQVIRQPQQDRPAIREFMGKFSRSATIVSFGVARNMQRVGSYIKSNLDEFVYPYRKPPK